MPSFINKFDLLLGQPSCWTSSILIWGDKGDIQRTFIKPKWSLIYASELRRTFLRKAIKTSWNIYTEGWSNFKEVLFMCRRDISLADKNILFSWVANRLQINTLFNKTWHLHIKTNDILWEVHPFQNIWKGLQRIFFQRAFKISRKVSSCRRSLKSFDDKSFLFFWSNGFAWISI